MSSCRFLPEFHEKIPLSAIVVTRNEALRLAACLKALEVFEDVVVVDSASTDGTADIARSLGARVVDFHWNGAYPKKYQWSLDNVPLRHDRVLFVDADEIMTPALAAEIAALDWRCAGYFVRARYVVSGRALRFGLRNNKLALLDRRKLRFPVVDDLECPDMGEIEGHYQPVFKEECAGEAIGALKNAMLHASDCGTPEWAARHWRYARWEVFMDAGKRWPEDPVPARRRLKRLFKALPFRPMAAFLHSYVLKLGVLDGIAGYRFARSRARYYRMISDVASASASTGAGKISGSGCSETARRG